MARRAQGIPLVFRGRSRVESVLAVRDRPSRYKMQGMLREEKPSSIPFIPTPQDIVVFEFDIAHHAVAHIHLYPLRRRRRLRQA